MNTFMPLVTGVAQAGKGFGAFKPALADLAVAKLSPITSEMSRLMKDPAEIDRILGEGAARAFCDLLLVASGHYARLLAQVGVNAHTGPSA